MKNETQLKKLNADNKSKLYLENDNNFIYNFT